MNYFMFLPQVQEVDVYDKNGQQTDDINSVVEWVRVTLGYDKTADDEDDDSGTNYLVPKCCDIIAQQQQFQIVHEPLFPTQEEKIKFPEIQHGAALNTFIEVATPPPDAAA
jgi:hypothetical protein